MENPSNSFDPKELSKDWFETKKFLEDIKPTGYLTLDNNFNEHIRAVLNYRVYESTCGGGGGEPEPGDPGTGDNTKIPTAVSFIISDDGDGDGGDNLDLPMYNSSLVDSRYNEYAAAYTPDVPDQLTLIAMLSDLSKGVVQGDKVRFGDTNYKKRDVDLAKLYGFDLKEVLSSMLNYKQSAYLAYYNLPMKYQYYVNGVHTSGTAHKHGFGGLAFRIMLADKETGTEKVLLSNIGYTDTSFTLTRKDGSTETEGVRKYNLTTDMGELDEITLRIDEEIKKQTLIKLSNLDPDVQRDKLTSEVKTIPYSGTDFFINDQYVLHIETAVILVGNGKLPTTFEERSASPWTVDGLGLRHPLYKDMLCQLTIFDEGTANEFVGANVHSTVKAGAICFREIFLGGESFDRNSTKFRGAKDKLGVEQTKTEQQLTYLIDDEFTQTINLRQSKGNDLNRLLDENGKVIGLVGIYDRFTTRTMQFESGITCLNTNGEFVLQSGRLISPQEFGFTNGFVKTKSRKITFLATSDKNQKFQQQLQGTELMTCGYVN